MTLNLFEQIPAHKCLLYHPMILMVAFLILTGCSTTQTVVEKTTKEVTRTTRDISRKFILSDEDLKRSVSIINFENNTLQKSQTFQDVFHKGLPDYLNSQCPGITLIDPADETGMRDSFKAPPKLVTGIIDGYALTLLGRQLGLNAIVTGSLEDIRIIDEMQGVLWTKETQHLLLVFIRVEVFDTRTATKILDNTFDRRIEIDDLEYRMIRDNKKINLPELNDTMHRLLTDIGDSICDAVRDQPWNGYITKINEDRFVIPSGTNVGLELGDILEVYDSSRTMEGIAGQRFFIPGLKIGEIEIVSIKEKSLEAKLITGEGIKTGSTVQRK
ncbi:MAG: hypothetical protein PVF37_17605 [Desulfobacterales bacterium]